MTRNNIILKQKKNIPEADLFGAQRPSKKFLIKVKECT